MSREIDPGNQIVVTGMGCVTPLGLNVERSIDRLMHGGDGIQSVRGSVLADYQQMRVHVAAPVEGFDLRNHQLLSEVISPKDERKLHRSTQFGLWAGVEALRQAGLMVDEINGGPLVDPERVALERVGVSLGTGIGGGDRIGEIAAILGRGKRVPPSTILQVLPERSAAAVSMIFGANGPVKDVTGACATGNMNIIEARRMLLLGEADVVLAGGTEAQITPEGLGLFDGTSALDQSTDPQLASRPFHRDANGFVMGEGAGVLVLETLAHARERGAVPLAAIYGAAEASDAYHETAPSGDGAERALLIALGGLERAAQLQRVYVNAHATGTAGDAVELQAIGRVLRPSQVNAITSTKGATGHLLGAAGAFESIASIAALNAGTVPPNLKLDAPIEATEDWNMSPGGATHFTNGVDVVVNNSFGFGGLNAVVAFEKV